MPRRKSAKSDDELVFRVADLFFRERLSVREIANKVGRTRQDVYPMLARARDMGFVQFNPPVDRDLAEQIIRKYKLSEKYQCPADCITVVNTGDKTMMAQIAEVAADRVLLLLRDLGRGFSIVGLGLGPGRATLDLSLSLATRFPKESGLPRLNLFAITAGCPPKRPEVASTSFFNLYPSYMVESSMGFFAETVVPSCDLVKIRERTGVREALARKDEINIVVTAMGDFDDEHDLLRQFLEDSNVSTWKQNNWIGNVQYRPFTEQGPVVEGDQQLRAVTLFELDEFVEMARTKNRYVVLIARQCAKCGQDRANAIHPLLCNPLLKVWSEIVMDRATAEKLLRM